MLTRMLFLFVLVAGGIAVLCGAWPASFAPPSKDAGPVPLIQPFQPDPAAAALDAGATLEKALAQLAPQRSPWLHVKFRQTLTTGPAPLVAEGFLQRGPHQCVRMEMALGGETGSRLIVVSDGQTLATVRTIAGSLPTALVQSLPDDEPEREKILSAGGCGGPAALLGLIQKHLRGGRAQTGLWDKRPVIRIEGEVDPADLPAFASLKFESLRAQAFLAADTLMPVRLEWWDTRKADAPRLAAAIEFHDLTVAVPLPEEECARLFTYQPSGRERVTVRK